MQLISIILAENYCWQLELIMSRFAGVPFAFKGAIPSNYHRGLICEQPVTVPVRPVADEETLDLIVVVGQEVEVRVRFWLILAFFQAPSDVRSSFDKFFLTMVCTEVHLLKVCYKTLYRAKEFYCIADGL